MTHDVPPHRLVVGNPARPIGWVCISAGLQGRACPACTATNMHWETTVTEVFPWSTGSAAARHGQRLNIAVAEFVRIQICRRPD